MTSIPLSELLIEAPARRHFAQLYREVEPLGRAVHTYMETGIRRGAGLVLIACQESRDLFLQNLRESGVDIDRCRKSGQLSLVDAAAVRARVMRGARLDRGAFFETVQPFIAKAARSPSASVRVYGEVVNLLWRDGLAAAAAELEGLWNEMIQSYPLSLFCAYLLSSHPGAAGTGLHEICRQHTDVILGGPGRLFEGHPPSMRDGQFGVNIGELPDYGSDDKEERGSAGTRLWLLPDGSDP